MHLIRIGSTQNSYSGWEDQRAGGKEKPESTWKGMDMVEEQIEDYAIRKIKNN